MKIQIIIERDVDEKDTASSRTPFMKILRILAKDNDSQVKWYMENRDRLIAEDKARRAAYAREQYQKRRVKKQEEEGKNVVVMPEMPADNILTFP